jgi:hypothetical protein
MFLVDITQKPLGPLLRNSVKSGTDVCLEKNSNAVVTWSIKIFWVKALVKVSEKGSAAMLIIQDLNATHVRV